MSPHTITIHDLNRLQGIPPDWFALGAKAAIHYALTADAPAKGPLATLLRNPLFSRTLPTAQRLQTRCFTDPASGLTGQVQADLLCPNGLIVDLQPTPARTYREFIEWLDTVQYHTQAAFLIDATQATRLVCLGIQTSQPYKVYYFEATALAPCPYPDFIEAGRQHYKTLLRSYVDADNLNYPQPPSVSEFVPLSL